MGARLEPPVCLAAGALLGVLLLAAASLFPEGVDRHRRPGCSWWRRQKLDGPPSCLLRRDGNLPPLCGPNFPAAFGTNLALPSQVAQEELWIKPPRKCFSTTAVKMQLAERQSEEDHALLLTSAAPDIHFSHSFFALIPSWIRKNMVKREASSNHQLHEVASRMAVSSAHGITFQKCAVVATEHEPQRAYVKLLINNTNAPLAFNVTDLVLLDNITGLHIQGTKGNKTADGFQKYRIQFLQVGGYYSVDYIAVIRAKEMGDAGALTLPAKLTFRSSSLNSSELGSLTASFRIIGEKKTKILFSHGIHALGFFIAFVMSFILSSVTWWTAYKTRRAPQKCYNKQEVEHDCDTEYKLEHSHFNSPGGTSHEDIFLNDQIIDILFLDESEKMLQFLEDFEIANLTCADRDLEAYRTQICKDVITLSVKNMVATQRLSPHVEKRMSSTFQKLLLTMEMEIQEEYKRKMVALTAECNLENRKEVESQQQKKRKNNEEAEELIKQASEKSAAECRPLLEKIHKLEHHHIKRFLMVKQEEYFAKAYRELAISQRNEIHNIFFTQIRNAILKGELKLEAAKSLVEDYCKMQGDIEELMDFLQAHKKYHLSKIFAHREYLIQIIRLLDSQMSSLWSTAASQIGIFISKVERAGHLAENHLGGVLNIAQAELHSAKQKIDHVLKQEKQKIHQKLIHTRQQEMLQQKEKQKEQMCPGDAFRTPGDICQYLEQWQKILAEGTAEFEELNEKLDNEAEEELVALRHSLTERAAEEIRHIQYGFVMQELLKLHVPKQPLQQMIEDHKREIAQDTKRLEKEDQDKMKAAKILLQRKREKLNQELQSSITEQRQLREWEQLVFLKLLGFSLVLSEEELLKIRQEFHSCFSQMDCSLALPKIRARVLLQTYQSERREAALQKVDQNMLAPNKQQGSKVKKKLENKNQMDVLKKALEKKIHIYESYITDEHVTKILSELQLEREHQLQALENKLGEYITSLQFRRIAKTPQTLEFYKALVRLRALLLEELSSSKTLTKSDCAEILEQSNHETEELEKKMQDELLHQELAQRQHYVMNRKRWSPDSLGLTNNTEESNSDGQVSTLLWKSLNACKQLVYLNRQRSREVQSNIVVLENILETIEIDTLLALYTKELRLATYLTKLIMVPVGPLHRIMHLLLPMSSQSELLSILRLINSKYSEIITENDGIREEAGNFKRKFQESWQALETKMRQEMINTHLRDSVDHNKRFSVLKQKQLTLLEKSKLFLPECLAEHFQSDEVAPVGAAEVIELTDTKEKIFVFRDSTFSLDMSTKKKKKTSFLNSKKSALLKMDE
ncbi:limbin [Hemicordylus capensis]|uniref:limbin n=1 Tax=Hemicordylus capensis TaxID=884348 RepID=UPI00230292F1|nr:limbin [Hemicordylus capensis]